MTAPALTDADADADVDVDVALSITAAAREAPDRPALITASRTLTFADVARLALRPGGDGTALLPLVAHPSLGTVLAILASLEARRPLALLHPRAAPDDLDRARAAAAAHAVPAGTLATIFTSGSTGRPRGAVISRAAAVAAAAASAANLGWRDDDRWLCCLPLAHAGGLTVVLRCLIARRPLILHEGPFDAAAVAALASSARATLASLVPTQLDALVAVADAGAAPPPWRAILLGGAAAAPALLARAAARGLPFVVTYGMTESLGQVATAPLSAAGRVDAAPRALPGFTMTAGTATAPAPITVAGPSLLTGWLGEPARDAGAPLTTSDLGWLDDDGGLHVVGRADDVIVTGGENVHPAQVEAAVAGAPGVAAACAFGIADPRWGQVVACAVVGAADLDLAHLDGWLAARLPAHLRPRRLIRVDVLPVGPTGKIDCRAAARACAGAASPA